MNLPNFKMGKLNEEETEKEKIEIEERRQKMLQRNNELIEEEDTKNKKELMTK